MLTARPLLYRCCPPSPDLAPYVSLHWSMQGDLPAGVVREEYLHPEGGCGLIFNQGDSMQLNGRVHGARRWINGPSSRSAVIALQGRVRLAGVRFLPGAGRLLLQAPLHELLNHSLDSGDFPLPAAAEALWQELPLDDLAQQKQRVEQGLRLLLARQQATVEAASRQVRQELQNLSQRLRHPTLPVERNAPAQPRQVQRLFRDYVGIAPHQYFSQLRAQLARERIKALGPDGTLTEIAHELNFHDQAHFIRDFQRIVGLTPGQYRRRQDRKRQP
ncbi:MAG: AraC family transcriptional regulator [Alcaligenes sp.]